MGGPAAAAVTFESVLRDHGEEMAALDSLLADLRDDDWLRPTPAEGWDIRDTVAHLAMGDEMALECVVMDRVPDQMQRGMEAMLAGEDAVYELERGWVEQGRTLEPSDVIAWWRRGNEALREALADVDPSRRLPWGPNRLSASSFVTARLMEIWAHGLDCFDAVDKEPIDTDRLKHIAHLALRALPYAFMLAGLEAPAAVRLELKGPSGDDWTFGPDDAPTVIRGSASDWCRVGVRRDRRGERERLTGDGPDADSVIAHVRAYL